MRLLVFSIFKDQENGCTKAENKQVKTQHAS